MHLFRLKSILEIASDATAGQLDLLVRTVAADPHVVLAILRPKRYSVLPILMIVLLLSAVFASRSAS